MRIWPVLITCVGLLLFTQCGSDEESAEQAPPSEPPVETGSLEVEGSTVQISWIRDLTETFKAAELAYDLGDTNDAILTAESLLVVSETAMDTLPPNDQLTRFILVFTSDVYASLRRWYATTGQTDEARQLSERYLDLAERMQRKRDSASRQAP
ncbi:MAG: hypothetical protein GF341_09425 [candidate division Zixibacteria bacterium]|nr:hypothetical protein [candidate division Zixibacteria bacterium]